MTASYPTAIKSFTTKVDGTSAILAADINGAQDEAVAIETALGVSPFTIDDSVTATASPTSIANYLDMVANRVKAISGGANWYTAPATSIEAFDTGWSWTAPTLLNSWADYGNGYNPAGYYKDSFNIVHLRGMVKSGAVATNIFVLPTGYRPALLTMFLTLATDAYSRIDVYSDGSVYVNYLGGASTYVSLDKIMFPTAS